MPISLLPMLTAENSATIAICLIAIGILGWGFYRNRSYGKIGILAWLQSSALMLPWLVFFGSFALDIYINLAAVLILLLISTGLYIWLGNRLRLAAQDPNTNAEIAKKLNRYQPENGPAPSQAAQSMTMSQISYEDLEKIRGIFGIDTFFATETIPYQQGAIFKGNLRGEPTIVHDRLQQKMIDLVGDKYRIFLVEGFEDRPVVVVLPNTTDQLAMTTIQKVLAVVLLIATIGSSLETAGIFLGFDFYAHADRWQETLPLSLGLWTVLISHELGHWLMAQSRQVKLSWPNFLPTAQIGAFGAITRFASILPDRSTLFDISIAGPATGGLVATIMLLAGLLLSHSGTGLEIPAQFFQSSILVGALAKVVLGNEVHKTLVTVHPLVMVGWLGMVITALNLMPAGQLDGGRMIQAVYGRKTAQRMTIATLVILGIVVLTNPANSLILYWAVLVGFLQRSLERPSLNELTEPNDIRAALTLIALFLMIVILIPFSPELADQFGIGN